MLMIISSAQCAYGIIFIIGSKQVNLAWLIE